MTWIYDHTEVITLIIAVSIPVAIIGMALVMNSKAPEASELDGYTEAFKKTSPVKEIDLSWLHPGLKMYTKDDKKEEQ